MADTSPLWKIGVLAAVVAVAVTSFVGGGYTYGTLSDSESASVEIGAAANFGSGDAGNADGSAATETMAGAANTDPDSAENSRTTAAGNDSSGETSSLSFVGGMQPQTDVSHAVRGLPGGVR